MGITEGGFLSPEISEVLGLNQDYGFLIISIAPESPADKAGLQGGGQDTVDIGGRTIPIDGDIIVSMDGKQINEFEDICSVLEQKQAGDSVRFVINRDGRLQEVNVTLEEAPPGETSDC